MLSQLKTSYQRLEQSLQRLTDSIAAYNPSPAAANDLVAADEAVAQDLEKLQRHQSNYARLQSLRQTTSALDEQLRRNIQLLADIRNDIKAIPVHAEQNDVRDVPVSDLLSYAKFISKTSVPPTLLRPVPEISLNVGAKAETGSGANGIVGDKTEEKEAALIKAENVGLRAVDEQTRRNLDPLKDLPFEPWPAYAVIQQGALADIQRMVDAGKDPASMLSAEEQVEAERLEREEEEKQREKIRLQEERMEMRRMSTFPNAGARATAQNDVFDPDEA